MPAEIVIRHMVKADINGIVQTFAPWHKDRSQYESYLDEQQRGERVILVALHKRKIVGYVTIVWTSSYEPFRQAGIPEIIDLNVITEYQKCGIGTDLIHAAERIAIEHNISTIGIGAEQSPAYAAANRLYLKLGYSPDGRGVTQHDNELHFMKNLREE